MDASTSQYIDLAGPIAIRRLKTAQLVKDVPAKFWDEDFFVALAKEHNLADIFNEVQNGLLDGESSGLGTIPYNKLWITNSPKQEQVEQISYFIVWKQIKSKMLDKAKKAKFRESFRIALETTIPLDEKEAQLIKKAKEAVASSDDLVESNGAVYEITKFSPLYNEADLRKRVLDSLAEDENFFARTGHVSWGKKIGVQASYIRIIREACENGRFEAALNLAVVQTEENKTSLLAGGVAKLVSEILRMLRSHPAAVEKEYVRAKTRFANFENCQEQLPNFMNLYSICFQLRCEREKMVRLVDHVCQQYRGAFEADLLMLDNSLGISSEIT